ncbi:hypothetical protein J3F84DRAFT_235658 [Trichoderma pleuroticola]
MSVPSMTHRQCNAATFLVVRGVVILGLPTLFFSSLSLGQTRVVPSLILVRVPTSSLFPKYRCHQGPCACPSPPCAKTLPSCLSLVLGIPLTNPDSGPSCKRMNPFNSVNPSSRRWLPDMQLHERDSPRPRVSP